VAFTTSKWWYTDKDGREIGWLFPEDFVAILEAYYGVNKSISWVLAFGQGFGFSRAQVDRWAKGVTPIPKHVAMIVSMLGTMKTRGIPLTLVQADHLPDVEGANAKLGVQIKPYVSRRANTAPKDAAAVALLESGGVVEEEDLDAPDEH
jgi:hypothetical protein